MKVISFCNHKGGVGKTTTTAQVAINCAKRGCKVLMIDLDAQANLTSLFIKTSDNRGIYNSFAFDAELECVEIFENLWLCPSSLDMARAESVISGKIARELILTKLIKGIENRFDLIFCDCAPSLGIITSNALIASDFVFVPLTAEALPLKGLKMLSEYIDELRAINSKADMTGIIITRYNKRNLNNAIKETLQDIYKDKVLKTIIRENIAVAETHLWGADVGDYAPNSNGAQDYKDLTDEILNIVKYEKKH